MKIILIILSIIGLLKLVSLFIMVCIEIKYKLKLKLKPSDYISLVKEYGLYRAEQFYIIPTITFCKCGKYFEISFYWFNLQYYSTYNFKFEKDE